MKFPNPQYQGFQRRLGSVTTSFNLQDNFFTAYTGHGGPVFVAFHDSNKNKKTFGAIWKHDLVFRIHYDYLSVTGSIWTLIGDYNTSTFCSVVIN